MSPTFALPALSNSASSLDSYIHTINSYPMLSLEEEISLGRRLRDDNDLEAAGHLVMSHLRVVVSIARKYVGYGLPQADLIQEGNIGLMKAVKRFDPERGVRLVSFAMHWIKAEMHEYILRNWRMVKIATTKGQRKLFFNLRSHKTGLNSLSPDEASAMAKELGVKREEVLEMEARFSGQDVTLEPLGEDGEDGYGPLAYLSNAEDEPSKILARNENEQRTSTGLMSALGSLDARSRHIVEARWLREDENATLHDLAAEYNISAERVRQIEQKAFQKMKAALV
ncbi:RNA polymerase sigma factor RpoH [Sulfuriferula multivorans]|uniref:RNA polymerase sigma factor RpoH n=1 Tax=Sulfuriferula multivorans TaxID=1559896 RepID=A0A401JDT9_9PROT|nr:RNA polymerase sigma factor RpoH [Sulfuriferula multivorans]GBL45813.1 RNA polymerase sigma factor RpoH [Sulfuriferula multivorans]